MLLVRAVLDGSNFRLVALFVLCFVTILLHDFFHDCNEDRVDVDTEGFELSFHNKKVAFDSNTKSIGIGCFHLRTGGGKEDQYAEEGGRVGGLLL